MQKSKTCCAVSRQDFSSGSSDNRKQVLLPSQESTYPTVDTQKAIRIPGGDFLMGTNDEEGFRADGEGPVRAVTIHSFLMDATTVTNNEFAKFVDTTGYQTDAEKFGWSFVFELFITSKSMKENAPYPPQTPWWLAVKGAYWKQPEGPGSDISNRGDHPVVHISWNDALAYCAWAGKRLPTEAEWEYAARGGLVQKKYPWGDELTPGGVHHCNIWQGAFPEKNTEEDGFAKTAPAAYYPPNGYGLYQMAGNVWEWCADWFTDSPGDLDVHVNPAGPKKGQMKVMRGGSYLCHHSYCNRYRVAARSRNTPDSSSGNMGFRCAQDR